MAKRKSNKPKRGAKNSGVSFEQAVARIQQAIDPLSKVEHPLTPLLDSLRNALRRDYNVEIPEWFEKLVRALDDFDPGSTPFRYSDAGFISRITRDGGEYFIDLCDLKRKMGWMAESFQMVRRAQR